MVTALLVLDMLTDFTSGKLANPAAARITGSIGSLPGAARRREDTHYGAEVTTAVAFA